MSKHDGLIDFGDFLNSFTNSSHPAAMFFRTYLRGLLDGAVKRRTVLGSLLMLATAPAGRHFRECD